MELRHLRYFVAAAEERSFVRGARRLRIAQPALSKQVRDLERELGVDLLERLPRGVRLTPAGEAFLIDARTTLEAADRAIASARTSGNHKKHDLRFAHGELSVYAHDIERLLAGFRDAHPESQLLVSSKSDAEIHAALRDREIDVASVFIAEWPVRGFHACRILNCSTTGVLLPAGHPLATNAAVRLPELRTLTWLHSSPRRWPGFFPVIEDALRDRGLVPERDRPRPYEAPSSNLQIASGETWALASEAVAAPYQAGSTGVVYRPFVEAPIPCWIALVWLPEAPPEVGGLVDVARRLRMTIGRDEGQ